MGILAMVYIFFKNKSFLIVPILLHWEIKPHNLPRNPHCTEGTRWTFLTRRTLMIGLNSKWRKQREGIHSSVVACWMSMSLWKVASGDESCIDTRAQSLLEKRTDKKSQRKFNVNSTLAFFMLKLANPSVFFVPSKNDRCNNILHTILH